MQIRNLAVRLCLFLLFSLAARPSVAASCPGQPPAAVITAPLIGESVPYPANLLLEVAASDSDGTVTVVELYSDGNLLGSSTALPYSFTWTNTLPGTHALTAVAVDDAGCRGTSAVVTVKVGIIAPTDLTGLKVWLDAGVGVTSSGGLVSQWADQSGNNNHASEANPANQPLLQSGSVNGLPAIRFDGNNDLLSLANFPATNTFSVYVVARALLGHEVDDERLAIYQPEPGSYGQRYLFGEYFNVGANLSLARFSFGTNGATAYEYSAEPSSAAFNNPLATYAGDEGQNFTMLQLEYRQQQPFLFVNGALARIGIRSPRGGTGPTPNGPVLPVSGHRVENLIHF